MTKEIFLIAGEASGDALGAELIKSLKAKSPDPLHFSGVGGPLMEAEGLENLLLMDELAVMGLWEVIAHLPRLLKLVKGVVEEIEKRDPAAVITIDLPDFNFEVGRRLKKHGKTKAKLIHYVAPSVWAWRPKRAEKIAKFLDAIMCLFPFEPAYFKKYGLRAEFVEHPLTEQYSEGDRDAFRAKYSIAPEVKTLGLFFGSRQSEFSHVGGIIRQSAMMVKEQRPDLELIIPTLPDLEYDVLKIIEGLDCPSCIVTKPESKWDAFAACDAAIAVSGTVGLELAYAGVPHVITYKMNPLTWVAVKNMVKVKYAHLANILLNEPSVPEFLQGNANPVEISKEILKFLAMKERGAAQVARTQKIRELLGVGGETPSEKAAAFVLSLIKV